MWGDTHHPVLSQTDGRYDGKHWLWINDKANGRVASIDLRTFETAAHSARARTFRARTAWRLTCLPANTSS